MLSVRWRNFRLLRDTGEIELRPLTLLVGANGSGKSSLIKPLLLMKQTVEDDSERALVTSGHYTNCGAYSDLVALNSDDGVRFDMGFAPPVRLVRQHDVASIQASALSVEFAPAEGRSDRAVLNSFRLLDGQHELVKRERQPDGTYTLRGRVLVGRPIDAALDRAARAEMHAQRPQQFLFDGSEVFASAVRRATEEDPNALESEARISQTVQKYVSLTSATAARVRGLLDDVKYLGPLRAMPERSYRVRGVARGELGNDGRFAPEVIYRCLSGLSDSSGIESQFIDDLQKWLSAFDLCEGIETGSELEDMFSLNLVDRRGRRVNLADAAFGTSQLLPFLVLALRTGGGQVAIAEQPEIHLNPSLQSRIVDVCAERISRGASFVLETHSEHIVTRARTLVASGALEPGQVGIYYIARGPLWAQVRRIDLHEDGTLDGRWPSEFFGATMRDARELSKAQREWRLRRTESLFDR